MDLSFHLDPPRRSIYQSDDGAEYTIHRNHLTGANDDGGANVPFAYTAGRSAIGLPEVVLVGFAGSTIDTMLADSIDVFVEHGSVARRRCHHFTRISLRLDAVPIDWVRRHVDRFPAWPVDYDDFDVELGPPELLQLVFSGPDGRFPDDPYAEPRLVEVEPLLGRTS